MVKISVIVPVYNVEKYLARGLDSIINQTLQGIEIICVNDGSTDNSLSILEEYAQKDKRIKIINQENQKQGAARNRGLEIAQGKYITFVDSDDWIDNDYLEKLYNSAEKYNVNIAASSTTRDYKHKVKNHLKLTEEKAYIGADSIIEALENNIITHSKLYRFDAIRDLRFEEGVFYEDGPYTLKAIHRCNSMVTVPEAYYHYYSNSKSTIKQSLSIKNENDKISTNLQIINYAEENNIKIKDWLILKESYLLWTIKHYKTHRDYYFFGIKIFSKNIEFKDNKTFLVFNTACFGDILLCNSLCQNIKNIFPESKVVFVTDKNFEVVAKHQESVDEVVVYDKRGMHKGMLGLLKFVREFKYKNIYASFITYKNERNYVIAKLLGSRFVKTQTCEQESMSMQEKHNLLLQSLTHKPVVNYPIKYNLPNDVKNVLSIDSEYVVLCTTSKRLEKDMPIETAVELINKINSETNYKVVFVGTGKIAEDYANKLKENNHDFIDLTNKTTIPELGIILKNSKGLISVDTGTMHYGCALQTPTVAVFYEDKCVSKWAPNPSLYNSKLIDKEQNAEHILDEFRKLLMRNKQ